MLDRKLMNSSEEKILAYDELYCLDYLESSGLADGCETHMNFYTTMFVVKAFHG